MALRHCCSNTSYMQYIFTNKTLRSDSILAMSKFKLLYLRFELIELVQRLLRNVALLTSSLHRITTSVISCCSGKVPVLEQSRCLDEIYYMIFDCCYVNV